MTCPRSVVRLGVRKRSILFRAFGRAMSVRVIRCLERAESLCKVPGAGWGDCLSFCNLLQVRGFFYREWEDMATDLSVEVAM